MYCWYDGNIYLPFLLILQPRTSLEKEIAAVLKGSAGILERRNKELTEDEEKALQAVDLEEVGL